ncbi:hypothetical protein [Microbacterium sp. NPDC076895]|uniref:hypothetical protein n=1 Tax=Microbacterium sp. NPDC076895 TaxID=3154957 RepID=UPI00344075C3
MHRGIAVLAVGFVGVLGLVGCTETTPEPTNSPRTYTYGIFDTGAEDVDTLPEAASDLLSDLTQSMSRYAGDDDGTQVWAVRGIGAEGLKFCLVLVAHDQASTGCTSRGVLGVSRGTSATYQLVPDGDPAPDGAVKLAENVFVVR